MNDALEIILIDGDKQIKSQIMRSALTNPKASKHNCWLRLMYENLKEENVQRRDR